MIKQELKKIFIKRGFIFVLFLLIISEIIICIIDTKSVFLTDEDKRTYELYCEKYKGPVTEEKHERIRADTEKFNNVSDEKSKINKLYFGGKISKDEYYKQMQNISFYLNGKTGFTYFSEDSNYAFNMKGRAELVNSRAWTALFGEEKLDILFSLIIIIFAVSAFVAENETNFRYIKITTPEGGKKIYRKDLLTGGLLFAAVSFLVSFIRYIIFSDTFSLTCPDASAESISLFENTNYELSLFQAYIILALIRGAGYFVFNSLCFILGSLFRNSLTLIMGAFCSIAVPSYILSSPEIYYIPPVGLIFANGLFKGDSFYPAEEGMEAVLKSEAVPFSGKITVLILSVMIVVISFFYQGKKE